MAYERNQTCLVLQNLPPCTSPYDWYTLTTSGNVNQCATNGCHLCLVISRKRERCGDPFLRDDELCIGMDQDLGGRIRFYVNLGDEFAPGVELAQRGILSYFITWETG